MCDIMVVFIGNELQNFIVWKMVKFNTEPNFAFYPFYGFVGYLAFVRRKGFMTVCPFAEKGTLFVGVSFLHRRIK